MFVPVRTPVGSRRPSPRTRVGPRGSARVDRDQVRRGRIGRGFRQQSLPPANNHRVAPLDASDFLTALGRKIGRSSRRDIARFLGLSETALYNWKKRKSPLTPDVLASAVVKAVQASARRAQAQIVTPIAEFFPITVTRSRGGAKSELFATDHTSPAYRTGLRKALQEAKGIYIFYDSRGRALYAGKAKQQSLWSEMKNAFNRDRDTQKLYRVRHPKGNVAFRTGSANARQPRVTETQLHELAKYFSAYKVSELLIDDVEAMLVRGFANDLLNKKMERFRHVRAARATTNAGSGGR